ncbi:MAG: AraC family transcriptional regulator [Chitinophagaceae bacterium]
MNLYIKNMVCDRCIMVVQRELELLDLHPISVELGVIELSESSLTEAQATAATSRLQSLGFELLEDRKSQTIEAIKTAVIELIHQQNDDTRIKHSEYLALTLGLDYPYLSRIFSEEQDTTIEQYIILQKIEKVKELLSYGELTLSEIAWQMGYSSVAALSTQFKKMVGVTPSGYKDGAQDRTTLDKVGKN